MKWPYGCDPDAGDVVEVPLDGPWGLIPTEKSHQLPPIQTVSGRETRTPADIHTQPKIVQIQRGLRTWGGTGTGDGCRRRRRGIFPGLLCGARWVVQAILRSNGLHPRPVYRVHLAACGFRNGLSTREGYKTFSKRGIASSPFGMPTDEDPPPVCLTLRFQIAAVSRNE